MTEPMNARELIAQHIGDQVLSTSNHDGMGVARATDAILAAMPDIIRSMVVPMVWSEWRKDYSVQTWNRLGILSQAESSIGTYRVGRLHKYVKSTDKKKRAFDSEYSSSWYVDAPLSSGLLGPFNGDVEAKAAANAYNVNQIIKLLGENKNG